jgi:hypothetical protein
MSEYTIKNFEDSIIVGIGDNTINFILPNKLYIIFPMKNRNIQYINGYNYLFTIYGDLYYSNPGDAIGRHALTIQNNNNISKLMLCVYNNEGNIIHKFFSINRLDENFAKSLKVICKAISLGISMPTHEEVNRIVATHDFSQDDNFFNSPTTIKTRNIPAGSANAVMINAISDGNSMVNFQGEFNRGRYYKKSTYNQFPDPKKNPFSRQLITSKTNYKARVPAASGGRRTRKGRRGSKHTRKAVRK